MRYRTACAQISEDSMRTIESFRLSRIVFVASWVRGLDY
jgi:hypothetical protein